METLTDNGRCCFVWLLEYWPFTDKVCGDVLDVVEGTAGETVIELRQEENYRLVWATLKSIASSAILDL